MITQIFEEILKHVYYKCFLSFLGSILHKRRLFCVNSIQNCSRYFNQLKTYTSSYNQLITSTKVSQNSLTK